MKTIYHFYIEALTNTPYEPNRPVKDYYERLPEELKVPKMKEFLWKLSLYPRLTTLKELEELWEEVKKRNGGGEEAKLLVV